MKRAKWAVGAAFIAAGLLMIVGAPKPDESAEAELMTYVAVPDFTLIERSGRTVTLDEMKGKVWVADFIFTRCAGICLAMSARMSELQTMLPPEVQLVSFSVDPAHDTPEVLTTYAGRWDADTERWMFLTGDRDELYKLTIEGFKLAVDGTQGTELEPITHSSRFVLVDSHGNIRGYYGSTDEAEIQKLAEDVNRLL